MSKKKKIFIFYHFYYPDDVVSAIHIQGLAEGISKSKFDVEVITSNRSCRNSDISFGSKDFHNGVKITRLWRPNFNQASLGISRLLNSIILQIGFVLAFRRSKPDVVITGTDPIFGFWVSILVKFFNSSTKLVHWCYDLHPEGSVAGKIFQHDSYIIKFIKYICNISYSRYDHIVDIGKCMRERLLEYKSLKNKDFSTIVPWAVFEPPNYLNVNKEERSRFKKYDLVLMYSGNFGFFHEYKNILSLADKLSEHNVCFVFSVRGNSVSELKESIPKECNNIQFIEFASYEKLNDRLSCADIHIVSLKKDFTGLAIPSKFFGSLAIGRPVLFSGSKKSNITKWINDYNLGWSMNSENIEEVATEIIQIKENKSKLLEYYVNSYNTYLKIFSLNEQLLKWNKLLIEITK